MNYFVCILIIVFSATFLVQGQQPPSTWLGETERARFETLRRAGIEALYNLDYDKAQRDFKEIASLYPAHPGGPQLLATRVWIKTLYETRRLQSSLYSSESFYTNGDDKVDPKVVEEFRRLTREAKRLAEAKLKQDPKNVEALDSLATTEGLKASFEEAVERRHFAALRDGNDAVDHHRAVLKLDPKFIDAQLTVGLYEYVVGYTREQRFADALALTRDLSAKYPRNYLFRLETADALVSMAEAKRKAKDVAAATQAEKEAFATFDELLRDRAVRDTAVRALDLIHFKYGEVLLLAGQQDRAAREFLAATKVERAEPGLVTMAHLYAARAFDVGGKRDEAMAQYKEVLARPNVYDSHDEAKKGLRQAYKAEQGQGQGQDTGAGGEKVGSVQQD